MGRNVTCDAEYAEKSAPGAGSRCGWRRWVAGAVWALVWVSGALHASAADRPVKVFILAGQSNMEGKAPNTLLDSQAAAPATSAFYAPFRDGDGWAVRDDVFIAYGNRHGPLTVGYGSPNRTGPELGFGTMLGDALDEPVLLIKTAWGGHSLVKDFRSPSSGLPSEEWLEDELAKAKARVQRRNENNGRDEPLPTMAEITAGYGASYRQMLAEVQEVMQKSDELFPALAGRELALAGFVWFQGWNDQYGGETEYAANMEHFIRDVRNDLSAPELPFVIAAMGQHGSEPVQGAMEVVQQAQLSMNDVADFQGNLLAIRTNTLVDTTAESLYPRWKEHQDLWQQTGGDHRYHYLGSGIWFTRIGQAMAEAMLELLDDQPVFAYVGTFSSPLGDVLPTQVDLPPGNGRGIHCFRMNRHTGNLRSIGTVDLGTSPSSLVVNAAGTRLYSANETAAVGPEGHGTVSSYAVDRQTGTLTMLNTVSSGAAGPTYVSLHPEGRHLLVANYFGGAVSVLPLTDEGLLEEPSDVQAPEGEIGPTRATHAPPGSFAFSGHDRTHAHMVEATPDGRFVFHVDLGLDRIFVWKFDAVAGTLTPAETPWVALPPGDGPRHFDLHPNGRWFYSIQEEGATVALYDFDAESGTLTPRLTWPTVPPGFAGSTFCSEILISADGRHLYAGNRLHDSIAVFAVEDDGVLNPQGEVWSRGNYPRSFHLDPSGRFLTCCNQRSDNLAIFSLDATSGMPTFSGTFVPVGNPSCVVFLDTAGD